MKIALELNNTECQVLIDLLDNKIAKAEAYRDTHKEYWTYTDTVVLSYKVRLRNKIQKFSGLQETLAKED